jgi:undecaprenyl-diphosphatase
MPDATQPKSWKQYLPQLSFRLVVAGILFMASLCIFAFIVYETFREAEVQFDIAVNDFFGAAHSAGVITAMQVFTFFGSSYFLLPAYLLITIWFLIKRHRGYSINIAFMGIGSTLMVYALKVFFHRGRPESDLVHLETYSFPSGHTVSSFIFCALLAWLVWRSTWSTSLKWLLYVLLLSLTFTIGISRIILRAHYPTDVAAGFCLGAAWSIAAWWFAARQLHRKQKLT